MGCVKLTVLRISVLFLLLISVTYRQTAQEAGVLITPGNTVEEPQLAKGQAARIRQLYERLPLSFEVNQGQADARVSYLAHGRGYDLFLTPAEAILLLNKAPKGLSASVEAQDTQVLKLDFQGANRSPRVRGLDELPGIINYVLGNDPNKWRRNIHSFGKVQYRGLYPGIDLVFHGDQGRIEYDLVVSPGADPGQVRMAFHGAQKLELDGQGNLLLRVRQGTLQLQRPSIFQKVNGVRKRIRGSYVLTDAGDQVEFQIARYDRSKSLVIDPVLLYSTYLGGGGEDGGAGIAVDGSGNAYVTGFTGSTNFPVTPATAANPALQNTLSGTSDAFVTKFDPTGKLVYSTYLGGSNNDSAAGIAVDTQGNAYITGQTVSPDFPVVNAFQSNFLPGGLFKSTNAGTSWSPSGLSTVSVQALAINPQSLSTLYAGTDGGVFKSTDAGATWTVTSLTNYINSNALIIDPVTTSTVYAGTLLFGVFKSTDGGTSWNLASTGLPHSSVIYSQVTCLAIDPMTTSNLYAGITANGLFKSTDGGNTWNSTTLTSAINVITVDPLTPSTIYAGTDQGLYKSLDGGTSWSLTTLATTVDALAVNPASTSTLYAGTHAGIYASMDGGATWTLTGLNGQINSILVDRANAGTLYALSNGIAEKSTDGGASWNAITTGLVQPSSNTLALDSFTNKIPAVLYAGANASNPEAFVAKLNPSGSTLLYSTYLGGTGRDQAAGIAIDPSGSAYVTGTTGSRDWPTTPGAYQTAFHQIFVAKLNPGASGAASLVYSTFLGGSLNGGDDHGLAIAADAFGNAYITGRTIASDFPTTPGAYSTTCNGTCSAGQDDGFVTELNPSGSALVYSTYLGGAGADIARGIAVDSSGSIYVVGDTLSTDFPTVNAFQVTAGANRNVFVSKLNPNTSGAASLTYSTYLGGSGDDYGGAIVADKFGIAYITGSTNSADFPLASATQPARDPGTCLNGCSDAFVAMLNTAMTGQSSLVFSTYLGGSAPDNGTAIAVDGAGSIYVTGMTEGIFESTSPFPVTPGALQSAFRGGSTDAFVAKIASAGLSIFITPSVNTVAHGSQFTYNVTVTNIGPNTFSGVIVNDVLPTGVAFVTASPSCTGNVSISCVLGTIPGNSSLQLSIAVTATGAGQVSNTATVTANETNPTPSAATSTAVVNILSTSDLAVTMSASSGFVAVAGVFNDGGTLTYTIRVTNNGPDPAAGVTLADTFPVFLSLASGATATQGSCSFTSQTTLTCNLGMLASGATATITLTATASFQALGVVTNSVTVSASNISDPNPANNIASLSVTARNRISDISITKGGPATAPPGGNVTYTIVVANIGPDPAGGVLMLDTLDTTDLTFVSANPTQGTCSFDGTTVDCDLGVVPANSAVPITLIVTVRPSLQPGFPLTNTARAGFSDLLGADPDPNNTNNTSSTGTAVSAAIADLSITKTAGPNPVPVGGSLTYTITVTNNGPDAAPFVNVTDPLDPGVTLSSATASAGTCSGTTLVSCQLGTMSSGSTVTITIVVTPGSFGLVRNSAASVTGSVNDPFPNNNSTPPLVTCAGTPLRQFNIAYIPVKYFGEPSADLTIAQVTARAAYVRNYYLQQSMCAVQFNNTIVSNPSSLDGWWTLPSQESTYFPGGNNQASGNTGPMMSVWSDAFTVAGAGNPGFLLSQKAGFFDAIVVIDTSSMDVQRSTSLMNEAVRDRIIGLLNPAGTGSPSVLAATLAGAIAAVVGGTATTVAAFAGPILGPFAPVLTLFVTTLLAPSLPRVAVEASIFEQGSVVITDQDDSETWAHELGHGIFSFWDYYGDLSSFSNRGDIIPYDVMSNPRSIPPQPVSVYNRQIAGWVQYSDIPTGAFGGYPLTALEDLTLGSQVFRYQTPRDFFGYPKGPTAWYIFELRTPGDQVPVAPEEFNADGSVKTHIPLDLSDSFSANPLLTAGQTGVVMYDKREINRFLGIPVHNPFCGPAHGLFTQGLVDTFIGLEFGSCLWKVNNVMQFPDPGTAKAQFTLTPGGPGFVDDMINTTFSLDSSMVLQIHGTAFSRTVVSLEVDNVDFGIPGGGFPSVPTPQDTFPIDLHVYSSDGRHFGPNYATGGYDLGITGARTGGAYTTAQWISIPDSVQATYVIDASQAAASAKAQGLQQLNVNGAVTIFRYDANGVVGKVTDPVQFTLNLNQPVSPQNAIPLGANLGPVQDVAPPVVTPPAATTVLATEAGGARVSASMPLATFLATASATDDVDPFVSRLLPQVGGVDVTSNTLFPLGPTVVLFRFQDASGKIGTATSTVTVDASTITSITVANVPYGTPATVSVSTNSVSGTVAGSVMLSVDGGAPLAVALAGSSAIFNVGILPAGSHTLSATFPAQGYFAGSTATGVLSVSPVPLLVTANNATRTYGAANPSFSVSGSGFVNSEGISVLGGALTCATAATALSPVGNYPISCSGLTSTNYTITFAPGNLSLTRAPLTITANNLSKQFDALNPPLTWVATGFVNGENIDVLTTLPTCTTTATTTSPVGNYPIGCSGAAAANYSFAYVPGTLSIICHYVSITLSPSSVPLGGTINVMGKIMSCANATQIISVQFKLAGPLLPVTCARAETVMFQTPPFALPPKTSQSVSFPFRVPAVGCPGGFTVTSSTLVNGTVVDTTSTALTVTKP